MKFARSSLILLCFLSSCATTDFTLIPSDSVRPFEGLSESSSIYEHNHVSYVVDMKVAGEQYTVSLRVYNGSGRTVTLHGDVSLLADTSAGWVPLRRTSVASEYSMTANDERAATWADYITLAQLKDTMPESDFKERETQIAERISALNNQIVLTERTHDPELQPREQRTKCSNFLASDAKLLKIVFVDESGRHVEAVYKRS